MGVPTRSCLACRRRGDKSSFVRLVARGGTVAVDVASRLPGRGAYLCPRQPCLDAALRRDGAAVARALRLRGPQAADSNDQLRAAWHAATRHTGVVEVRQ